MFRISFLFFLLISAVCTQAQKKVWGTVIDAETKKSLPSANVFLSNTSIGTISDNSGAFVIDNLPDGKFEFIVSLIGYETFRTVVRSADLPIQLQVKLKPKVAELQEVIVNSSDKNGWEKWGAVFMEHFMGTSLNADETKLLNPEILKFYFNEKTNILTVRARDMLQIENNALGYILKFDLTHFEYNTIDRAFTYMGYPFFEEMQTTRASLKSKWQRNREDAYRGSRMHFVRSLFTNQLKEQGFEVRKKMILTAEEKIRVKLIYEELMRRKKIASIFKDLAGYAKYDNTDTLAYFKAVHDNKPGVMIMIDKVLPASHFVNPIDSVSAYLVFSDHLEVSYPTKKFPAEYERTSEPPPLTPAKGGMGRIISISPNRGRKIFSDIHLSPDTDVIIYSNGSIENGWAIITSDYWSWWEKMANKLPYDFVPVVPAVKN